MRHSIKKLFLALFSVGLISNSFLIAWALPSYQKPILDELNLIPDPIEKKIDLSLEKLFQSGGSQLAVAIVESLENLSIEEYSIKLAEKWKLGDEKKDNGIIIVMAIRDRQIRIEVGHGLEGSLTDIASKRIIDDSMVPLFRDQRFTDGLLIGIGQILKLTDPQYDFAQSIGRELRRNSHQGNYRPHELPLSDIIKIAFFLLVVFLMLVGNILQGRRGSAFRKSHHYPFYGGGGPFSGPGSGGFGGGGSFGGGGASGRW